MKSTRSLVLRRETLTDLTDDELSFGGGALLTLQADCSYDDVNEYNQALLRKLTLHQRCTWSCI